VVPGEYEILVGGNSNDADLRKCSINVVKH